MAFKWAGSVDGSEPIIIRMPVKDTVVLSRGEMVNAESGEADSGAAADTALVGITVEDVDNTADGEYVSVIMNPGAIYADESDANARYVGETLDLASGALAVAASSSATFIVVAPSTATEPTLVTFNQTHLLT